MNGFYPMGITDFLTRSTNVRLYNMLNSDIALLDKKIENAYFIEEPPTFMQDHTYRHFSFTNESYYVKSAAPEVWLRYTTKIKKDIVRFEIYIQRPLTSSPSIYSIRPEIPNKIRFYLEPPKPEGWNQDVVLKIFHA